MNARRLIAQIAIFFIAGSAHSVWASGCFDDQKLQEWQRSSKAAIFYVWSPRMVLSAQHASTVHAQAKAQGISWVVLHDPRVGEAEITASLERLQRDGVKTEALRTTQALCSPALEAREATRHFPTALVMNPRGELHPNPIVGAMPPRVWSESLRLRLARRAASPAPTS